MEMCYTLCLDKVCSYLCCVMPPLHVTSRQYDKAKTSSKLQDTCGVGPFYSLVQSCSFSSWNYTGILTVNKKKSV